MENLSQSDFAVVDGDIVIRDFRSLERSDETGLDIVLLVDASQSVAPLFRGVTGDVGHLVSQSHRRNLDHHLRWT